MDIKILQTSKKGAMLITDGEKTAWIMPKMRRADGTFTPGAIKSLKQSTKLYSDHKEVQRPKELDFCEIIRETEKAVLLKFRLRYEDIDIEKDVEVWLPKSKAQINNKKVDIDGAFWNNKKEEILTNENFYEFVRYKEYDKSYGVSVVTEELHTDQERRSKVFFPKSITKTSDGKLYVPGWLATKKKEEKQEEYKTGAYQFSSSIRTYFMYPIEKIQPIFIPCNPKSTSEVKEDSKTTKEKVMTPNTEIQQEIEELQELIDTPGIPEDEVEFAKEEIKVLQSKMSDDKKPSPPKTPKDSPKTPVNLADKKESATLAKPTPKRKPKKSKKDKDCEEEIAAYIRKTKVAQKKKREQNERKRAKSVSEDLKDRSLTYVRAIVRFQKKEGKVNIEEVKVFADKLKDALKYAQKAFSNVRSSSFIQQFERQVEELISELEKQEKNE